MWGYGGLRPLQAAAIRAAVAGRDCLTVLPTGGGKSLCYQVPPLVTGKVTVVASPLIALMRDQVRGLELNGYAAAALHSAVEREDAGAIVERVLSGGLSLLFAAPERMLTGAFRVMLGRLHDAGRLGAIAVDEAHCISHWGHDFRPEYRRLSELREVCPGVGLQAFTATATPRVREDIMEQLGLRKPEVLVGTFDRPNLTYRVIHRSDAAAQTAAAIERMKRVHGGGGAIVYTLSRKDAEELAEKLRGLRIDAAHYHAGMDAKPRHAVEERFTNERLDVVVATVAFGMGIDRSNVRLVVHATMPKSIEAYQQETGRAGRDGLAAECLLLHATSDASRWTRLMERSAEESGADAAALEAQLELVAQMRRFVASNRCRHMGLSEHFGQALAVEAERGCGACDVCLGETRPEPEARRVAQVLLSAVARTGQRFGAGHIADVVRGAESERVRALGHDQLSVYGMLRGRARAELVSYLDQLVVAGALEATSGGFETLRFGARGMPVMRGEAEVSLASPVGVKGGRREERQRVARGEAAPALSPADQDLFERLRALRRTLAEARGVPPYVVFSDATLQDLAREKPRSRGAMLEVKGVGPKKVEMFGDAFLAEIGAGTAGP